MFLRAKNDERRICQRLLHYWEKVRRSRAFPSENDIDPDELAGLWDHCFMVQLRDIRQVTDYNYTYFGVELIQSYEHEKLEAENRRIAAPDARHRHAKFLKVMETGAPLMEEDSYTDSSGDKVHFRQVLLPLGDENGMHSILGAVSWHAEKQVCEKAV
jgi:hypothetical protein